MHISDYDSGIPAILNLEFQSLLDSMPRFYCHITLALSLRSTVKKIRGGSPYTG